MWLKLKRAHLEGKENNISVKFLFWKLPRQRPCPGLQGRGRKRNMDHFCGGLLDDISQQRSLRYFSICESCQPVLCL